ncbi:hypothetical protein B6S59_04825 [Pseudomonas sp. A46]|uniref:prepilin-type N-terminal cleavage/methylation domain-containing protein n=1 Tax=Metapseudomonas furukawaii TaxID=1149133 RepID=UPI000B4A0672|nr:hypothetical protein B6S59_04825 [Pseudomonas sp. A46]
MQMSAICLHIEPRNGFTLLELVVVLALLGALGSLALPAVIAMHDSWSRQVAADGVRGQLGSLGHRSRAHAREVWIGLNGVEPVGFLQLPDGWSVSADPPIRYLANGACLGGVLRVFRGGQAFSLRLEPPRCVPEGL